MRNRNTTRTGSSFDTQTISAVWKKGKVVSGKDPNIWRKDECGAFIKRDEYGNTSSSFGWEVDHIKPASKGGSDELSNLQPLQWQNNRDKGDDYPSWTCAVKAAK